MLADRMNIARTPGEGAFGIHRRAAIGLVKEVDGFGAASMRVRQGNDETRAQSVGERLFARKYPHLSPKGAPSVT